MDKYINIQEDNINIYLKEANKFERLTKSREYELVDLTQNGDKHALDELINANLNFVISIAKQYQGHGVSIGDLINDGNEGILKAAFRFDISKGFKFISYAVWWVRQSIIQGINDNARMVRLPVNVINDLSMMSNLIKIFEKTNHREPNIGEFIGKDKNDNQIFYNGVTYPKIDSLNKIINEDGDEFGDILEDKDAFDPNPQEDTAINEELHDLLLTLTKRERLVIIYSFGLDPKFNPMTLGEIGERLDITKERVRQIKEKSLRKLRFGSINLLTIINN